jgi:hypothetical protein
MDFVEKDPTSVQILLIGFNRLEKLETRLHELRSVTSSDVFVSIDWQSENQAKKFRKVLENESSSWPKLSKFEFEIKGENLGLARHITQAISHAFITYKAVIVIEDDIPITKDFIDLLSRELQDLEFAQKYASVGGFSTICLPPRFERFNFTRESKYFLCWGWGTTREVWSNYQLELDNENFAHELSDSEIWNGLSIFQKKTWLGRFSKVASNPNRTWDIQFQYMAFKLNLKHILPVGRLTENDGFHDERSSNTKSMRPWYLGKYRLGTLSNHTFCRLNIVNNFFDLMLSITLIGDLSKPNNRLRKFLRRNS